MHSFYPRISNTFAFGLAVFKNAFKAAKKKYTKSN